MRRNLTWIFEKTGGKAGEVCYNQSRMNRLPRGTKGAMCMREPLGVRWRTEAKQMRQWAVPPRRGMERQSGSVCQERKQRETMRSARKKIF